MNDMQTEMIKKALNDVDTIEIRKLSSLPETPFTPSVGFINKVNELINNERKRERSLLKLSHQKKVAILVASVMILILTLTACIFIEEIQDFFISIKKEAIGFVSSTDENITTSEKYKFTYIPSGYVLIDTLKTDSTFLCVYKNDTHYLSIDQGSMSSCVNMDTENGNYQTTIINDYTIYYTYTKNTYSLIWKNHTNVFGITCHESLGWDEIEKIILGVKVE